jgi:FKBP-type peptidyl-prolyl cis-trans isomerase FkpA
MKLLQFSGLKNSIIGIILLCIVFSCKPVIIDQNKQVNDTTTEVMVRVNKYLVHKDADLIKSYIKRHKYIMTETESGLWYSIIKDGTGQYVEKGDAVTIKYKIELLDGTPCYSSETSGVKTFVVGVGKIEAGIDEGLLLMRKNGKTRFILPPHLGYGLMGDENKIPSRSTLVYEVELVDLLKKLEI